MAWFFCALGSAALWGLSYAMSEKLIKNSLEVPFYMAFTGFVYFILSLGVCLYGGHLKAGLQTLATDKTVLFTALATSSCYIIGTFLIYLAISLKNATLANIIEISYPVFTLIFAFILYRELQLNIWSALGGFMILSGAALVAVKS